MSVTMPSSAAAPAAPAFMGGGRLGELMAVLDWSTSPLGPPEAWPAALRSAVGLVLPAQAQIVLFWGPDYVALYNDAYAPTIGEKHPRALGRPARENWSELWDDLEPLLRRVRETGQTVAAKDRPFYIERHGYGEEVFFDISYSPVPLDDGSVGGVLCIVSETTERVRAQRQIVEERERLAGMFQQAPGFMALLREPGHVFELTNASYQKLIGGRDVIGRTVREALPELEGQGFFELLDRVCETGEPYAGKSTPILLASDSGRSGEERLLDFVYQPIKDTEGKVTGIFVEGTDVTDRVRAIEAQRESDARLKAIVDSVDQMIWSTRPDGFHDFYNQRWYDYTGVPEGSTDGEAWNGMFHPDDRERAWDLWRRCLATGEPYHIEYRLRHRSGDYRWVLGRAQPVRDAAGKILRWYGTCTDIHDLKLAEAALRESEERFRIMADSAPAFIWACDAKAKPTFANRRYASDFGVAPEVILQNGWRAMVHQEDLDGFMAAFLEAFRERRDFERDVRVLNSAGETRWLRCAGTPRYDGAGRFVGYVGCDVDITEIKLAREALEAAVEQRTAELRAAEDSLRQAQKMETVGQLTGGVAHDFNNLLQIVTGNLEILLRNLPDGMPRLRRSAENAMTGAKRAATLTQRLLAFSRRQPLAPKPTDPNKLVAGMSELLHRTLGETISVETVLASGIWRVEVDPHQLENALLNLAVNARDAMPEGGKLTIETANSYLDQGYVIQNAEVAPGQYVCICVTDTGHGMDAETVSRAFEPFFTTKEVGKGTGLGLSMVYGFVKQSGGHVKVYSEPGEGTTVKIYLPRLVGGVEDEEEASAPTVPEGTRDEIILVCEDDDDVRAYSVEVLRELGYRVLEAHDGPSALRLLERERRVDLLFTDVVLPGGMTGAVLAEKARALRPGLKVLFTTGYARNAIMHQGRLDRGVELITKPFSFADLAGRVRDLLDGQATRL
ncbi:hybrid sensor histidine kinase/response regulator [Enterovirga aerilata]|uniref:histidine kinase n=1 Tax=Enterovirga aerilata TaxID=2730920 RepID=A0A849I9Z7_9HYPH|nr:PAS domain S-box protein [Enterovirga sp. DB1703]NNM72827.1 PAS domain S-box protein [Enterovirga sp. DB1703]